MNTMLDYPLHFPGSNTTLPWAQTGMSLAVVLVALIVLVLSCCGAAALFLAACCGNRRRDTVAESGDSRWLPGIGLIDYVPVSNRSSVRVSLVLSDSMQDLEGGAEESCTPSTHVSQQSPTRPQHHRAEITPPTQRLLYPCASPEMKMQVSHSAPSSPSRSASQMSVGCTERNLWEKDNKTSFEFEFPQRSISMIWPPFDPLSPPSPLTLPSFSPSSLASTSAASPPQRGSLSSLSNSSTTYRDSCTTVMMNTDKNSNSLARLSPPPPPPAPRHSSVPAKHTASISSKPIVSPSQAERWFILPRLGHPNPKKK